jgi:tetratricopeptide (TPR) repeat protein
MNMSTNVNLAQAIAAARAGKTAQARILVDRILQDDPDNANAWFLLSTIAETEEEQVASLEKILEIEPNHEAAAARMSQLSLPAEPADTISYAEAVEEEAEEEFEAAFEEFEESADLAAETLISPTPPAVSEERLDFMAQEAGVTVPAWMADEGEGMMTTMPVPPAGEAAAEAAEPADLPDWLQEEPDEAWRPTEEAPAVLTTVEEAREAAKKPESPASPRTRTARSEQSNLLLVVLIALAVIVALALLYVLIAQPL